MVSPLPITSIVQKYFQDGSQYFLRQRLNGYDGPEDPILKQNQS